MFRYPSRVAYFAVSHSVTTCSELSNFLYVPFSSKSRKYNEREKEQRCADVKSTLSQPAAVFSEILRFRLSCYFDLWKSKFYTHAGECGKCRAFPFFQVRHPTTFFFFFSLLPCRLFISTICVVICDEKWRQRDFHDKNLKSWVFIFLWTRGRRPQIFFRILFFFFWWSFVFWIRKTKIQNFCWKRKDENKTVWRWKLCTSKLLTFRWKFFLF